MRTRQERDAAAPRRSPCTTAPGRPVTLLDLQRQAGNQAVARALRDLPVQLRCAPGHDGPAYAKGVSSAPLSNQDWAKSGMSTFATLHWDDGDDTMDFLGKTRNLKSVARGKEHAEDVALRVVRETIADYGPGPNHLILSVTKSPCSSKRGTSDKAKGCAEELIDLVQNGIKDPVSGVTKTFSLVLICHGLYGPDVAASQLAVNDMKAAGITVSCDVRPGPHEKRFEGK